MPATIQVILQQDVPNVGASGELVKVRPGFARNYLLPRQLAVSATTAQVNRLEHEKVVALAKAEKLRKEMRELADKIGALEIKIARPVGEDNKLFGSVTAKRSTRPSRPRASPSTARSCSSRSRSRPSARSPFRSSS